VRALFFPSPFPPFGFILLPFFFVKRCFRSPQKEQEPLFFFFPSARSLNKDPVGSRLFRESQNRMRSIALCVRFFSSKIERQLFPPLPSQPLFFPLIAYGEYAARGRIPLLFFPPVKRGATFLPSFPWQFPSGKRWKSFAPSESSPH